LSETRLLLDEDARARLWSRLCAEIEGYLEELAQSRVTPELDPVRLRERFADFDFGSERDPDTVLDFVVDGLREHAVQVAHPRYFGLFNPAPATASIAADALVATFNPQMAGWTHHPFCQVLEHHVLMAFAGRFGLPRADGVFCSGGAEANHTALLCALERGFPGLLNEGLVGLQKRPVCYVTDQSHHSFIKAARCSGLGRAAVRAVATDDNHRLEPVALEAMIRRDRADGLAPFLVVATAGTTNGGIIDPIEGIAEVAEREGIWCHVDAAWGGAAVLLEELCDHFRGIARADSITIDAHKWLSVPMGAGMFLTADTEILERTFRTAAEYMPLETGDRVSPFHRSLQWSRRCIGLKLFLPLAIAGWAGYTETIRHMVAMGRRLRAGLADRGWQVLNETPLPLACFTKPGSDTAALQAICDALGAQAWISTTRLGETPVLRACITNYRTNATHVDELIAMLDDHR